MEPDVENGSSQRLSYRMKKGSRHLLLLKAIMTVLFFVGTTGLVWATGLPIAHENPPEKPLVVAIQLDQTYTSKDKQGNWTGPMVDFWKLIAMYLKRPYVFREMPLNSIISALEESTIDVAAMTTFINAEREERFDFSTALGEGHHAVVTVYQPTHEHPWLAAVSVFFTTGTLTVILILMAMLFLLGVSIWLIEKKNNPGDFGPTRSRGIAAGIYWAGSTLASGLCFGIYPRTLPGRILALTWMITCGLALSAVIASLTHSLTDQMQQMQVLEDEDIRYMHLGVKKGSVQVDMLKEAGGYYTLFDTDEEALNAVLTGQVDGYLCFETRAIYYANHDYSGRISVYPTKLRTHLYALSMPKQSPLRKPINLAILRLTDDGVWESLLDRYGLERPSIQQGLASRKAANK